MCKAIDELIAVKRPLVSLTMIAKNEENTIEAAVDSVRPYVDEVVIGVDDKSEDGTLEIAKRIGDEVYEFEFLDFADARNKAIEHSTGDWWMCIDAHEIFRNTNDWQTVEDEEGNRTEVFDPKDDFRGFVRQCPAPAIDTEICMDADAHGVPALQFSFPRLARWWSRWQHGTHNIPNVGGGPRRRDWQMHHRRGQQAVTSRQTRDKQRGTMNVWTLRQDVKARPNDARAWFYLGNTYRELGEWVMALHCYMEQLKHDKWGEQIGWGRRYSAQCLLQLQRPLEAKEMILASLHDDPVRAEGYLLLGDLAYGAKRFYEAAHWYRIAATVPFPTNARLFVQSSAYGYLSWDKLSMSLYHIGDYKGAIMAAEKVLAVRPEDRVRNNLKQFKQKLAEQEAKKTNSD
jgi:tetratricopeptide (TPR) repeat protein